MGLITAAVAIVSIVGGVLSTVQQVQNAQSAKAQMKYQAQIEQQKQELGRRQIEQITEEGAYEKRQQRLRQEAIIAEGQAAGAAGGVLLGTGSLLDWEVSAEEVFAEDRRQLAYDIENRKYSARIGIWNSQQTQAGLEASADAYSGQIPGIIAGGTLSTIGSAFGAASAASKIQTGNVSISSLFGGGGISNPFAGTTGSLGSSSLGSPLAGIG